MSNNFDNTICSRTSVERYLLNKMTPDEETLFQNHLDTCNDCRDYLDIIRNVAGICKDEMPDMAVNIPKIPKSKVITPIKKLSAAIHLPVSMRWVMLAACLIPVCVIIFNRFFREPGIPHSTHIMHQNRATVEYADSISLFFPIQPICTVHPAREEIVFRWNIESDYRIQLESDGKTVVTITGTGMTCKIDSLQIILYEQLDWTLVLQGKELKGRLYIQK